MPLVSRTQMFKTLPSGLAETMNQHYRRRSEEYKVPRYNSQGSSSNPIPAYRNTKTASTPIVRVSDCESDEDENMLSSANQRLNMTTGSIPHPSQLEIPENRLCYTAPRMTSSLDNVDLWESEDSDSEGSQTGKFDVVNGKLINPRNTIDLADLRKCKSVVSKRRNSTGSPPNVDPDNSTVSVKVDKLLPRELRRLKTNPAITPGSLPELYQSNSMDELSGKRMVSKPTRIPVLDGKTLKKQKCDKQQKVSTDSQTPKTALTQSAKPSHTKTKSPTNASSTKPLLAKVHMCPVPSSAEKLLSSSPTSKKVKFSNMVSVQEGEFNTLDLLRNSNNSAQVYKNRYSASSARRSTNTSTSTSRNLRGSSTQVNTTRDPTKLGLIVC